MMPKAFLKRLKMFVVNLVVGKPFFDICEFYCG